MAQCQATSQASALPRVRRKREDRGKAQLEANSGQGPSKDKSSASVPPLASPVGYFVLYQIRAHPIFLFQVPPPPTMVDDGGHRDSRPASVLFPTKWGCVMETKEERSARHKALREKWGTSELEVKRQEANALQRKRCKEAETARLTDLGPQVLFLELFLPHKS